MDVRVTLPRLRARTLVAAAVVTVLVAGAVVWFLVVRPARAADGATTQTLTATAALETFEQAVTTSGTLTPVVNESISFEAAGTVTAVDVDEGDTVAEGDVLATIDTLQLDAALAAASYDLEVARASLTEAEEADDGSDSAAALIESRQAALAVAEAAYAEAEDAMDDATLRAPADGLVTSVGIGVGDVVGSSTTSGATGADGAQEQSGTSTSSAAITIVGSDAWSVSVSVSESDVSSIAEGDQVEMTADGVADTIFGVVTSIGRLPSSSTGSVTYPVTLEVTGSPEGLYDGVAVDVSIIYERRTDVLTIPSAALTRGTDGTTTVELVGDDGETATTVVEVGETSGSSVEIVSGLSEGDTVSYTIAVGGGEDESGGGDFGDFPGDGGDMPSFPGGGEMPSFPGGGEMPGGGGQG